MSCSVAALGDDLAGDQPHREQDEPGHDEQVVQLPNHGEEVGDQVNRRQGVAQGEQQRPAGEAGRAGVACDRSIHRHLAAEGRCEVAEAVEHAITISFRGFSLADRRLW